MRPDYDSILTHTPLSPLQTTAEYTSGQYIPDGDVAGLLRVGTQATEQWVVLSIVGMMVVLGLVVTGNLNYLAYRIKDFFSSERKFSNMAQQTTVGETTMLVATILIGCTSLSLIGHDLYGRSAFVSHTQSTPWLSYLLLAFAPLAWMMLKSAVYALVNWVFFDRSRNQKWMGSYYFLTSLFLGLMLPVTVLYLFTDMTPFEVSNCLLVMLILYEILLFFKMIVNFQTKRYGKLLIFLYFCTAEILPLLVAGHFVQTQTAL